MLILLDYHYFCHSQFIVVYLRHVNIGITEVFQLNKHNSTLPPLAFKNNIRRGEALVTLMLVCLISILNNCDSNKLTLWAQILTDSQY